MSTKACLVKAMVFPVVTYGCESWTIKKAEHWRIDAFERWCWRRLLRVPWTASRSHQSILKEISPEYWLEGFMLKLKLQYFGHLMWRTDSLENTLMLGKIESRRRGWQMRWLEASPTWWTWFWVGSRTWWTGQSGVLQSMVSHRVGHDWMTGLNRIDNRTLQVTGVLPLETVLHKACLSSSSDIFLLRVLSGRRPKGHNLRFVFVSGTKTLVVTAEMRFSRIFIFMELSRKENAEETRRFQDFHFWSTSGHPVS